MTSIRSTFPTILAAALLSLAAYSIGWAQDDTDIKDAISKYHAAIESRDISNIESVWAHQADVMLVNPRDTTVTVGWDTVKKRWEDTFNILTELKITQSDGPHISMKGDVAWSLGIVHVVEKLKSGQPADVHYLETDVFQKQDGHWLLVSHTARPI